MLLKLSFSFAMLSRSPKTCSDMLLKFSFAMLSRSSLTCYCSDMLLKLSFSFVMLSRSPQTCSSSCYWQRWEEGILLARLEVNIKNTTNKASEEEFQWNDLNFPGDDEDAARRSQFSSVVVALSSIILTPCVLCKVCRPLLLLKIFGSSFNLTLMDQSKCQNLFLLNRTKSRSAFAWCPKSRFPLFSISPLCCICLSSIENQSTTWSWSIIHAESPNPSRF